MPQRREHSYAPESLRLSHVETSAEVTPSALLLVLPDFRLIAKVRIRVPLIILRRLRQRFRIGVLRVEL